MKNRPIHENLDTSFVNLSALVKYLRRRQFTGQVRIELSGYEADIYLAAENILRVREYDHIAGRVAEGQEAFQRVLIRSREPGGIINVYQSAVETGAPRIEKPTTPPVALQKPSMPVPAAPAPVQPPPPPPPPAPTQQPQPRVEIVQQPVPVRPAQPVQAAAPQYSFDTAIKLPNGNGRANGVNGNGQAATAAVTTVSIPKPIATMPVQVTTAPEQKIDLFDQPLPVIDEAPTSPKSVLPNLPFEFTNKVEDRAKPQSLSGEDHRLMIELTSELLGTIDRSLAMAKLDFASAFRKARTEIAGDYPFLRSLGYEKGRIVHADEQMNPKIFVAGILEAIRRIMTKLGANAKFAEVHRYTTQRVLGLLHHRRAYYDKFNMSRQLEKMLGA